MSDARSKSKQRLKLALIPVLVAILGGVLFWPEDKDTTTVQPEAAVRAPIPVQGQPASAAAATGTRRRLPRPLPPSVDLSAVGSFNPFASSRQPASVASATDGTAGIMSSSAGAEAGEQIAEASAAGSTLKVDAIIQRDGSSYAYIDGQLATEGDVLSDGSTIAAITPDRVILQSN